MTRIVLTASTMWLSRLIRRITKGRVSHAMIQYHSDLWSGDWIAEAAVGGVQKRPAETRRHHVAYEFECLFDVRPGLHEIRKYVGAPYDYPNLVFFGWVILAWRLFKTKARRPWRSTRAQFCSELVWRVFQACSLPSTLEVNPESASPESVLCYMESHTELFKRL